MATKTEKILVGLLIATIIIAFAIHLTAKRRITTAGRIKSIGIDVCIDANCTTLCEHIEWGLMEPGGLVGATVFIKNTRNTNVTLTFNSSEWNPSELQQYFTLDWNYSGIILQPEQIIPVQISLFLSIDVPEGYDPFSFDIWIIAQKV